MNSVPEKTCPGSILFYVNVTLCGKRVFENMIGFRISKQEPSELRAGFLSSNRCPSKEEVNRGNRGNSCWKSSYKPRRPKVVRRDTRTAPLLGSQKDRPFPAPPLWTYAHLSWKPQGTNLPKLLVCVKPVSSHASCSPETCLLQEIWGSLIATN